MNQELPTLPILVSPECDLLNVLETRPAKELAIDSWEVVWDSFLKGFVKDVPVLRTLYAGTQVVAAIRDYIFAQKIATFLHQFRDMEVAE
jgi:hypothetical protein